MAQVLKKPLDYSFGWCKRGTVFHNRPLSDVREFLEKRRVSAYDVHAADLEVVMADGGALLRRRSAHEKGLPIRQAFFDKLMRWHKFPLNTLYRMSSDELLPLMNVLLRMIDKDVVVYVEDGEALTIVSKNYARIADDELLDKAARLGIEKITRTDHFMWIMSSEITQVEVQKGDLVGIATNIVNSETGFRALTIGWYLLRLVCSNGAIAAFGGHSSKFYHQKTTAVQSQIDAALNSLDKATVNPKEMFTLLSAALTKPLPPRYEVDRTLTPLLGFSDTRRLIDPPYNNKTAKLYDLFNIITLEAQKRAPSIQLAMEEVAGSWLWLAGGKGNHGPSYEALDDN